MTSVRTAFILACCVLAWPATAQVAPEQVVVVAGADAARAWLEQEDWWGEARRGEQREVPRAIITGINPNWRETSQTLPVADKKELFYRLMLPLIVHANTLVLERRDVVHRWQAQLGAGQTPADSDLTLLRNALTLLRVTDEETAAEVNFQTPQLPAMLDELLYKLDTVPAGLALGQAAYESGYGASRFAVEGNALFGQWTYGGQGLVPGQQRQQLGDHRIAAYDWPFDSVRGYFLNLMSHPAYEDFRRLRAEQRARGEALDSLVLADGLIRYSERGQEYVDTLKQMIRVNRLNVADGAVFRDEPMRFLIGAADEAAAADMRARIGEMHTSGELDAIYARMRLE